MKKRVFIIHGWGGKPDEHWLPWLEEELAKKAGINANFYAKVERGKAKPSGVTLTKIIKALGLKSTDILSV